ncbi:hypothetical protein JTE90_007527 [Oedothorax gibbosus]|uniref:Uncharacterized protein n=1 Tax=Oedothorax gibbosus TaxID=931172 RepID=A0AAV6VNH7_9ARAC|nr:hypothetical protein JTE90_007527 [Oedothorax gibbosus]
MIKILRRIYRCDAKRNEPSYPSQGKELQMINNKDNKENKEGKEPTRCNRRATGSASARFINDATLTAAALSETLS